MIKKIVIKKIVIIEKKIVRIVKNVRIGKKCDKKIVMIEKFMLVIR